MSSPKHLEVLSGGLQYDVPAGQTLITHMPDVQVVQVPVNGNPNDLSGRALRSLMGFVGNLKRKMDAQGIVFETRFPRGRWADSIRKLPLDKWQGTYAMPIPANAPQLPHDRKVDAQFDASVGFKQWNYGTVAYRLHVGSYSNEAPTIDALFKDVAAAGYTVVSDSHEEIYLNDPTMVPEDELRTLILYRVIQHTASSQSKT